MTVSVVPLRRLAAVRPCAGVQHGGRRPCCGGRSGCAGRCSAGCVAPDPVQPGQVRRQRAARRPPRRRSRAALYSYFSLSMYSSAPGRGDVLVQLVAGVDAPARASGRGERGADLEAGRAAVLQVLGEDVRGVDEEVRPQKWRGLVAELGEVLLELLLGVAPGEVGVRLLEADLGRARASSPAG